MKCHKCGKDIPDTMAYVSVKGEIVLSAPVKKPMVFTCKEQAFNYAQNLIMHDVCWIELLKEHGVELYDMTEVAERYKKKGEGNGLG